MSPELEQAICEAHPKMFALRNDPSCAAPLCWSFECGDGWFGIIASLCELISYQHTQARHRYEGLRQALGRDEYEGGPVVTERKVEHARRKMLATRQALPRVTQVKEKFGTLRFHIATRDPRVAALVSFAEHHSGRVCEKCGAPGTLRTNGWLRTLCDVHEAERVLNL